MEDAFTSDVVDALYGMDAGDTFAARVEDRDSPLGPRTEYCRVETVYDGLCRDHDRLMKVETRCEPSVDYWISETIYEVEADDADAEIQRLGGHDTVIHGVTEDVLAVDYTSDHTLMATCDECGKTGAVPVSEADLPMADVMLTETDDGMPITACCGSESYEVGLR